LERDGVDSRGAFYDSLGALKDVGQNHLLQMLSLVAMEKPLSFVGDDIRYERARVLAKLIPMKSRTIGSLVVRGQYRGYILENGVPNTSQTETYFRIKAEIKNARWKNTPIYLESGKGMKESKTAIDVYFKKEKGDINQNILTFRIQPNEGIKIKFFVKSLGSEWKSESRTLKFDYADHVVSGAMPNDYERLISDAFAGDQTLFASTEEIMSSWKFVMSILDNWKKVPLVKYEKGVRDIEG
jgi:glucose-6-phosphate 1-dehydrogenase